MHFVYPSFLFALSALAIPVIIHLFNFRRYKRVVFSDVRFLKQVQEESKAKRKLKEWLILAARLLALTALVLAFAQPFIPLAPTADTAGSKVVSLYIDNSFSMNAEGSEGQLLETARQKARSILNAYGNADQFQVITNDAEGRQQHLLSRTDALQAIDAITLSPAGKTFRAIYARQRSALEKAPGSTAYLYYLSDLQSAQADLDRFDPDSAYHVSIVPVKAGKRSNVYIDSAWLLSPVVRANEPVRLRVRIRNSSEDAADNIAITLSVNKVQKGLQNLDCAAGGSAETELSFTPTGPEAIEGTLSILDHPIVFDDQLYFTLQPASGFRIFCINGDAPSKFINGIYENDPAYKLLNSPQTQVDYSSFKNYQLIILNECNAISSGLASELDRYIREGGQVLVLPSIKETELSGYNSFLSGLNTLQYTPQVLHQPLQVSELNTQDELLRAVFTRIPQNMDLPRIQQSYLLQGRSGSNGKALIRLNNGMPYLWQSKAGKGRIYLAAAPLRPEWSNFQQHSLFVPVMLRLAAGIAPQPTLYYTIGTDKQVRLRTEAGQPTEKTAKITGKDAGIVTDVLQRNGEEILLIDEQLKTAGFYQASFAGNSSKLPLAMNYSRRESNLTQVSDAALDSWIAAHSGARLRNQDADVLQSVITAELSGIQLWRICVALALFFVLIEILLLKFLK